ITPLTTGLRIGGGVEICGVHPPPNYARSKTTLEKGKKFLPGLHPPRGGERVGYPPPPPGSLPGLGRWRAAPHVFYPVCPGHVRKTQAAPTGALTRDLAEGNIPAIDLQPFSPQRF